MSIYDDAGVIQIPSAYKKSVSNGTLYSVVPSNGDGDFTFTRGSSATRVNKDGLIEEVSSHVARLDYPLIDGVVQDCPALLLEPQRTNLVTYSEDFSDSSWIKSGPTLTYNQGTSPDGVKNATKMIPSTSSTSQDIFATVTASGSTAYTRSFFAKSDGYNWIYVQQYDGSTNRGAWFDLSTGSLGNTETNITSSIENFGNGWYKCSVTFTTQSGATSERAQIRVVGGNGSTTFAGNGTDGVLIWGAMVEQGNYPTSYIPTSGSTVTRSADVCNGSGTSAEFNDNEGVLFAEISALANDGTFRHITISDGSTDNRATIYFRSDDNKISFLLESGNANQFYNEFDIDVKLNNKFALTYSSTNCFTYINGFKTSTDINKTMPSGLNTLRFEDGNGNSDFYGKTKQLMTFKTALTDSELETLTSWDSFNAMAKGQLYTIE